ncbi:MAG: outer membrane protein assembly factor BamA [bacterium]
MTATLKKTVLWIFLAVSFAWRTEAQTASPEGPVVREVRIKAIGPVPVDEPMVRSYIAAAVGKVLNRSEVANDVRSLLNSGKITDVKAEVNGNASGVILTYAVRPKLKLVKPVTVLGAKELGETKVRDLLGINPGDYLDDPTVAGRVVKLREEYRKRLYEKAEITTSLDSSDPRLGQVTLTVRIREGDSAQISEYDFPGSKSVDYSVVREAMDIMAWYNPISWFHKTPCSKEELQAGCERLRAAYKDRGFLDVDILEPELKAISPGHYKATIPVRENLKYKISRVTLTGASIYPELPLLQAADLKSGNEASTSVINKGADAIRDYYESRGYMDTAVQPRLDLLAKAGDVDVRYVVMEGRLTSIRNVLIRGNSVTQDKVIRRELLVYPGEQYDGVRVRTSENRLKNLGFFSSATCSHEPVEARAGEGVSTNQADLVFDVEEQRTGQFMTGVGFSSIDKLIGFAEVSQGNFDIRGKPFMGAGEKIKLRAEFGSTREAYSISFVEPWFLDRKLSLSVDLYSSRQNDRDYDVLRQGGAVGLGVPLWGANRMDFKYRLEQVEIKDSADTNAYVVVNKDGVTDTIYFSDPRRVASSVSSTWTRDTRDNFFVPTRGSKVYAQGTLMGGPLGFDTELYDLEAGGSLYVPLWWRHVLSFRARGEVVDAYGSTDQVPLSERLFAGGARTVRGFRYRWVGPKAERADGTPDVRPAGGQSLAVASAEYTVPIPGIPKFRFATFYDIGNVWYDPYDFDLSKYAAGAGVGLRLDIPGFPMRFDYAWPVKKDDPRSRTENWSFWIGYGF